MADIYYMLDRTQEGLAKAAKAVGDLPRPPHHVVVVMVATCMLLGYPEKIGWGKIAQLCRRRGGADLAEMCRRCDLGDLPLPTLRRVRHLLADVNGDKVMKVCHEAAVIYLWCQIMIAGPDV